MQAIEIRETGGPDVLEYVTRAAREPGGGAGGGAGRGRGGAG